MVRRLALILGIAGAAGAVAREVWPDVRRYLRIRKM